MICYICHSNEATKSVTPWMKACPACKKQLDEVKARDHEYKAAGRPYSNNPIKPYKRADADD